jgi:hypothetical protein
MASVAKIQTSEGEVTAVPVDILNYSITVKNMLDMLEDTEGDIPLPNVTKKTWDNIQRYLERHDADKKAKAAAAAAAAASTTTEETKPPQDELDEDLAQYAPLEGFDKEYVESLSMHDMFDVLNAANFLDCPVVLQLGCKHLAFIIRTDTEEQMKVRFGLPADHVFTEEDKQAVLARHPWLADLEKEEDAGLDLNAP